VLVERRVSLSLSWVVALAAIGPSPDLEARRPATYVLDWDAPTSCPDRATIERRVEALLAGDPGGDGEMHVRAVVTQDAGRFKLAMRTEFMGEVDERPEVSSTRCEDLSETVALVVAIAMEPEASGRVPEESRPPGPDPSIPEPIEEPAVAPRPSPPRPSSDTFDAPVASVSRDDATAAAPEDPPGRPHERGASKQSLEGFVRIDLGFTIGALPRPGGGTLAAIGLSLHRLRVELFGAHLWPQRNRSDTGLFQLGVAGVRGCGRLFAGRVELPLCGGLEAGALRADSRGLQVSRRAHGAWVAALGGVGIGVRGRRVGFFGLAEAGVPLRRTRFLVGDQVALQSSPVTFRATAGIEFFFG
jgi:hypothetical protein